MATSSHGQGKGSYTLCGSTLNEITRFVETRNNVAATENTIDVSHLALTQGANVETIAALPDPSQTGASAKEFQIDYIGNTSTGPVFFTGQTGTGQTVTAASFTLAVGDVPRGSVTFSVS